MVFTTTALFKGIACPYALECTLTNCIFSHELRPKKEKLSNSAVNGTTQNPAATAIATTPSKLADEPALKRRKITYDRLEDKPPSRADLIRSQLANSRNAASKPSEASVKSTTTNSTLHSGQSLSSLTKPVTPPATSSKGTAQSLNGRNVGRADNSKSSTSQSSQISSEPKESLNPRLIANDPAGHTKRTLYIKHLHAELVRLNKVLSHTSDLKSRMLNDQQLIKMALDEEEKIAKDQPLVYSNIVKQRIALYKKMPTDGFIKHLDTVFEQPSTNGHKPINTGLSSAEELLVLPFVVADQTHFNLEQYGYVTTPPTDAQIAEAKTAVEISKNYEECDRCVARFQVWPDRTAEGRLTSNGPCRHHPNKRVVPQKTRGDVVSGLSRNPYYPCCNRDVGSPGCESSAVHVFKTSSPARLAATLPFISTPENAKPALDKHGKPVKAVAFDCEMGYTTNGMELIRLTAVSWPSAEKLVDVLVRPLGTVIDLNSRFSGVWPQTFESAIPYSEYQASASKPSSINGNHTDSPLPVVDNPQAARDLLCSFLTPATPLIGHAIDNDLNAVRLCHPSIVDTVFLFPHPRRLPLRYGLKMLSATHLSQDIQMGGDSGHDSLEDAQATGDLVRVRIGETWNVMRRKGFRMHDGQLVHPDHKHAGAANARAIEQYMQRARTDLMTRAIRGEGTGKKNGNTRGGSDVAESKGSEELTVGSVLAKVLEQQTDGMKLERKTDGTT